MSIPAGREKRCEVTGGCEVGGVVEPGVGADSPLKALRRPVDLSEELDLQPPFAPLYHLGRLRSARQLGNAQQRHLAYQVHQTLREAHQRADRPIG